MKKFLCVFIAVLTVMILTGCPGTGQDPEPGPVTYSLGDTGPAGGLIFYIDEANAFSWSYLEAAPASTEWINNQWGSYNSVILGTGSAIGNGTANTTTIVNWLNNNTDDTHGDVTNKTTRAAYLCDALTAGSCSDWFLPSRDELTEMYINLKLENAGGFSDDIYWSSSEGSSTLSYSRTFADGSEHNYMKSNNFRVRAVRAF